MYHISVEKDKPDIGYLEATISRLMERGIRIADCSKLKDYYVKLRQTLREEMYSKYGIENPNSSKQITSYLIDLSSQVDLSSRNDIVNFCYDEKTLKWTSAADAMQNLADLGYEFAQDLLDYRAVKKYAEILESLSEFADSNNLIHPVVTLAKTNRINYSKPGLMTIPKALMWEVIAPYKEGNALYSVDIKNQEPNLLINITGAEELKYALISDDGLYETMFKQCFQPVAVANVLVDTLPENRVYKIPELKQIGTISPALYSAVRPMTENVYYNDKKVIAIETICVSSKKGLKPDLPNTVAIELENGDIANVSVEWESSDKKYKKANDYTLEGKIIDLDVRVSKVERRQFKQSWLAISYGASVYGVKSMCKTIDGGKVYKYITGIEELKEYRKNVNTWVQTGNTSIKTVFGTKLFAGYIDDLNKLKRVMMDLPIQGTAADILSLLVKHFYDYTSSRALSDKFSLYFTRHDELIIEVDNDYLEEKGSEHIESILRDMLEHQINDWTPFKVEISQVNKRKESSEKENYLLTCDEE